MRRTSLTLGNTFSTHTLDFELAIEPELAFTKFAQHRVPFSDLDNLDLAVTEVCVVLVNNAMLEGRRRICRHGVHLNFGFLHDGRIIGQAKEIKVTEDVALAQLEPRQ